MTESRKIDLGSVSLSRRDLLAGTGAALAAAAALPQAASAQASNKA